MDYETNIDKCFENIIHETENLLEKHAPLQEVSRRKAKYLKHRMKCDCKTCYFAERKAQIVTKIYNRPCSNSNTLFVTF